MVSSPQLESRGGQQGQQPLAVARWHANPRGAKAVAESVHQHCVIGVAQHFDNAIVREELGNRA